MYSFTLIKLDNIFNFESLLQKKMFYMSRKIYNSEDQNIRQIEDNL